MVTTSCIGVVNGGKSQQIRLIIMAQMDALNFTPFRRCVVSFIEMNQIQRLDFVNPSLTHNNYCVAVLLVLHKPRKMLSLVILLESKCVMCPLIFVTVQPRAIRLSAHNMCVCDTSEHVLLSIECRKKRISKPTHKNARTHTHTLGERHWPLTFSLLATQTICVCLPLIRFGLFLKHIPTLCCCCFLR